MSLRPKPPMTYALRPDGDGRVGYVELEFCRVGTNNSTIVNLSVADLANLLGFVEELFDHKGKLHIDGKEIPQLDLSTYYCTHCGTELTEDNKSDQPGNRCTNCHDAIFGTDSARSTS